MDEIEEGELFQLRSEGFDEMEDFDALLMSETFRNINIAKSFTLPVHRKLRTLKRYSLRKNTL